MKRIKTIFLVAILVISTTYVLGVAAESVFMNNQQKIEYNDIDNTPIFFTEITFTIMINDGCGCNPIEGVSVSAFGGAGNDQNVTDINGKCILLLEINSEYTVSITHDEYIPVLFDFVVIDEQFFVFQMTLKDESVHSLTPVLNHNTILTNR